MLGTSLPSLLRHPRLPRLPRFQHLLPIPADLRLHDLQLGTDQQPHLPPELMGEEHRSRFAAVLGEAERVPEFMGDAVPVKTWEDLEGHTGAGS